MTPGVGWIAEFDQFRASLDESLQVLLQIAQERSESQTEAFLAVWCAVNTLHPDTRSGIVAAAVLRLTWETQP